MSSFFLSTKSLSRCCPKQTSFTLKKMTTTTALRQNTSTVGQQTTTTTLSEEFQKNVKNVSSISFAWTIRTVAISEGKMSVATPVRSVRRKNRLRPFWIRVSIFKNWLSFRPSSHIDFSHDFYWSTLPRSTKDAQRIFLKIFYLIFFIMTASCIKVFL